MLKFLSNLWDKWSDEGMRLPFVRSGADAKPSITLLFAYITFAVAALSTIALHFRMELALATWTAIGFWVMATVLYMIRKIGKAKFDLDDKSIDLEAADEEEEPKA